MTARRSSFALAALLWAVSLAIPAHAAPVAFNAVLTIQVGALPTFSGTGSGTGTSAGAGGAASIPAGVFSIVTTAPIDPPLLVIDGFGLGAPGQSGQPPLAPGSSNALSFNGTTGTMGLNLNAYLITGFAGTTPQLVAGIPLAVVGVGGSQKFTCCGGLAMITVVGNPFQLGMVTVMGALQGVPQTVMGTGYDNRNGAGLAGLQLVSPSIIQFSGGLGSLPVIAVLTFVPEPTTLVLLGAGLALLAGLRRGYTAQ